MRHQRKKTDFTRAIETDRSGEHWMTMVMKVMEHPSSDEGWMKVMARQLDIEFQDAITDAIIDYWVVLPPIEARSYPWSDYPFARTPGEVTHRILERRVRVMRATVDEYLMDHPTLSAYWYADPFPTMYDQNRSTEPWTRYVPEYDQEPLPKERRIEA